MVNMYGAGKAFGLRYQQNNYPRMMKPTNNFRQSTNYNFFGCGHQHSGPQQVTINNGPQGFWGFLGGLFGGFLGGGGMNLFGNSFGTVSPYSLANQGLSSTQSTPKEDQTQAKQLQNLKTLFPDYNIVAEEDNKFSASGKNGNILTGTYEEMKTLLAADKGTVKKEEADKDSVKDDDDKSSVENENNNNAAGGGGSVENKNNNNAAGGGGSVKPASTRRSSGSGIPGWYRAANDDQTRMQSSKGKNATEVTNNLLSTKLKGVLTPAQQNELRQVIINKNPSVFDKSGKPLINADYSKLDVPSMEWIKTNILKETDGNRSDVKGPNSATARVKKQPPTSVGNNQFYVNQFYTKGYRETNCKGIFYNESTKKHYRLDGNKLYKINADVRTVNSDGTWYDTKGDRHAASELR